MPAGYPYTEAERSFIIEHYRNGMTTEDIAKYLGKTAQSVKKWAAYHRNKGVNIKSKIALPGERREHFCKMRRCTVVKEKLESGKWKVVEYKDHLNRRSNAKPVGYERHAKSGAIWRKTESGWDYIKKPKSEHKAKQNALPVGAIQRRTFRGIEREFEKQTSGQWKIVPIQFVSKVDRKPAVKSELPKKTLERKSEPKKSYDPTKNPDKVKIPVQEGGHYVRIDAKTLVYRKHTA